MNCLYDKNRFCLEAHKVTEFNQKSMQDICLNCQSHELTTIQELFKRKESWTAEQKIAFALKIWEGGDVNLIDLSAAQKSILIEAIKKKLPTFLEMVD